jgi:tetratricopeptide (TPR) repeat protein
LDAASAEGYLTLARVHDLRGNRLLAEEFYSKALAVDPNHADTLSLYANMLAAVGRLQEALAMKQRTLALDPFVPVYNRNTAYLLWLNGQTDAAITMLRAMAPDATRAIYLASMYASMSRYGEAADALLQIPSGTYPADIVEEAVRLLRRAPSGSTSPQTLPNVGNLDFVYLHVGAPDRVHDYSERLAGAGYLGALDIAFYWQPSAAPARKSERFKALLRTAGFVDYWRARGWPDFCRPVVVDDFVCD